MKILLAGMTITPNNFTRALESYGCEYTHVSGVEGNTAVPTNCDAAVIAVGFCSHDLMWKTKEAYKKCFIVKGSGFSGIKENFEDFLRSRGHVWSNGKMGTLEDAFKQLEQKEEVVEEVKKLVWNRERMVKIITDAYHADLGLIDTAILLKEEGLSKKDGGEISAAYVGTVKSHLGLKGKLRKNQHTATSLSEENLGDAPKRVSNDLIGKILNSKLSQERKLFLIQEVSLGKLTTETSPLCEVVEEGGTSKLHLGMKNITDETDRPVLTLNRLEAILVVKMIAEIRTFAEKD